MTGSRYPVGLFAAGMPPTVDAAVGIARTAADAGLDGLWFPQTAGLDALTALAVIAREVPGLRLGTGVVPIQGRHPVPLAMHALTVADAAGPGRFTLGVGVTHASMSEPWFGVPFRGIVDVCTEVVETLAGLLGPERRSDIDGAHVTSHATLASPTPPPGFVLAALGPRMLELAGRSTDGTITWMTGPTLVGRDIVPRLEAAAERAGRPAPRVVVGIQVCVTDDVAGGRERVAPMMGMSASLPIYERQLAAEGVSEPVDLALIGSEDHVLERLEQFRSAGMTELCAHVLGTDEERARTLAFLGRLAGA